MRTLGIDPGTRRAGWGVVERSGAKLRGVAAGVIVLDGDAPLEARLAALHRGLEAVLDEHTPTEVAVEDVFFARSARSALVLGHARGVALLVAGLRGLVVHAYPPAVVKKTVAGHGAADKGQVAKLVGAILGWRELPPLDATDALALAITHSNAAQHAALRARVDAARAVPRGPRPTRGPRR